MSEKFFVGARLRRLRTEHGLSQSRMAEKIDISSSYLNLLESNQRPLSISVLMKINEKFDIDITEFTRDHSPEIASQLFRVLSDPININTPMTRREINDLANSFPNAAQSMINMYDRFGKIHEQLSIKKFVEKHDGLGGNPFDVLANVFLINAKALELVESSADKFLCSLFENEKTNPSKSSRNHVDAVPNILPQLVLYADTELDLRIRFIPANVLGKSARLYDPHKGEILINGKNIKEMSIDLLRSNISLVSQNIFLFADTIYNNIVLYNKKISINKVIEAAKKIGIHNFITKLPDSYNYNVKERGVMLSEGQKQLISFLRAYVSEPTILVLDEATSSIDSKTEKLIQYATSKIIENKTSIIIAHRLSTILNSDKIILLDKGEIKEIGTHDELLKIPNGYYKKLFELQFQKEELVS